MLLMLLALSVNKDVIYAVFKDRNFMLELSSVPDLRNSYFDIHIDAFHLAFDGYKTIEAVASNILENGGTQEGELYRNKIGDYVLHTRVPNGFVSQFIHRVNPFYPQPVKSKIRYEHFAFNTPDQKTTALWYVEFMNLNILWSKDIDTTKNNYRNYRVSYVGDSRQRMSMELFEKELPRTIENLPHDVVHNAFTTNEPEKLA